MTTNKTGESILLFISVNSTRNKATIVDRQSHSHTKKHTTVKRSYPTYPILKRPYVRSPSHIAILKVSSAERLPQTAQPPRARNPVPQPLDPSAIIPDNSVTTLPSNAINRHRRHRDPRPTLFTSSCLPWSLPLPGNANGVGPPSSSLNYEA